MSNIGWLIEQSKISEIEKKGYSYDNNMKAFRKGNKALDLKDFDRKSLLDIKKMK